ncbi:hypothetical protein SAMN05444350_10225 [Bacteroides stercorirosoris]|uniref:Uncharacterized protein n=1 Tax=Bacteroides stercorirosoris TaxID=871324 RepID=A0A1M6AUZ2_9BACE|nr:hypothetical protein SAMN05444350_10225 [Bacteroides stercorirosoris]
MGDKQIGRTGLIKENIRLTLHKKLFSKTMNSLIFN